MNQPIKILLITIWMFFNHHKLFAQIPTPQQRQLIDKVIASVDDEPLFRSELEAQYAHYQQQVGVGKGPTRCEILENMIINKIMLANAVKKGIHIKEKEIAHYFDYQMENILKDLGSEARLEQYLKQVVGKSLQVFKEELRKSIKDQLTIERIRNTIVGDITISPTEAKTFFNQLSPNDIPFYPASVEVYHLVIYPPIEQQERAATLAKLETLKTRIQAGEEFGILAKQYSEDIGTATHGGELGFWRIGELDPVYEKAALALKPGEISATVETKFGLHLIQLIGRQKSKYNTRHILLKPIPSEPNLQEAIKKLNELRIRISENQLGFEKAAINYSEDMDTARKEGLLTGNNEGIRMPVDQLSPDLFFIIDKMTPGTISEPITFTTSTGKQAARIVYLKNKIASHQANLGQDHEKIQQMALTAKKQKALDEWIELVKEKAVIELDPEFKSCKVKK